MSEKLGLMAIECQHAPMRQPDIRLVDLEVVLPLRRSVLRAGIPDPVVVFAGDSDPRAVHVAAFDRGEVVGVSSLVPDPRSGGHPDGLRIRMVGVLPGHRSGGVGRRLVEACVDHSGATPEVWLAARRHLEGWYGSMGFVTVGDPYDKPPTGIHVDMVRAGATD
jgi:predicted GNAT family N-acyltransferase